MINPTSLGLKRRDLVYQDSKLLLANFALTEQKADLEKTKGNTKGPIGDYFRIKTNIKTENKDGKESPMNEFYRTGNKKLLMFDFNWWPLTKMEGQQEDFNEVFIYQLKGCNVNCNFCFVDRFNNNGAESHGAKFFSVEELVDSFAEKKKKKKKEGIKLNVLRPSGGEPSLVPEQWLAILQELDKRGLSSEVYLQSDTNLTTGHMLEQLMDKGELDKCILNKIAEYDNFGLLSCFKGTDPERFTENTQCNPKFFEEQFYSYNLFANAGIAIYPHIVNPNSKSLEMFADMFAADHGEEAYKLLHLFSIGPYGPVKSRLERRGEMYALAKIQEWRENYAAGEEVLENLLQNKFGIAYKDAHRPDIVEQMFR
ncbi:MAG: 4Fe-4S cluster-binding domain-containing protein [Nanoarchaeota archaeon]|nr:4Fe-4S cluster-binding domain-containing protein [Nanoarchaeota archaeon]